MGTVQSWVTLSNPSWLLLVWLQLTQTNIKMKETCLKSSRKSVKITQILSSTSPAQLPLPPEIHSYTVQVQSFCKGRNSLFLQGQIKANFKGFSVVCIKTIFVLVFSSLIRRDGPWAILTRFDRGTEVSEALNSYQWCNLGHDLLKSVIYSPGTV